MRAILIIWAATIHAILRSLVLRGRILYPISIAVIMAARIDHFGFRLAAGAGIIGIAIGRAACGLLALQHPSVAAAGGAGPAVLCTSSVVFVDVSPKILCVSAPITFIVLGMTASFVCSPNVDALQ